MAANKVEVGPEPVQQSNPEQSLHHLADSFLYLYPLSGRQIRLLQILPGPSDSVLNLRLITKPLDEEVIYHALSYAWGDASITKTVLCEGRPLEITENLHAALWQFREDRVSAFVWADAICINQSDMQEKTAQVRMMRDIYQQADLVVAWLGVQTKSDALGFKLMHKLNDKLKAPTTIMEVGEEADMRSIEQLGLPNSRALEWAALCSIMYKPYFFRVWIVQEILVAKSCVVRCGSTVIERDVVIGTAAIVDKYHMVNQVMGENAPIVEGSPTSIKYSAKDLWLLMRKMEAGERLTILQLLWHTRIFKATDNRDRVFALVGLAADLDSTFIDYEKDIDDILIEVAKACMLNDESWGARMLSWVDSSSQSNSLPSWVPDWTKVTLKFPLAPFFAGPNTNSTHTPNWRFVSHNGIELEGWIFDEVGTVVHDTPYLTTHGSVEGNEAILEHTRRMMAWNKTCWELAKPLNPYLLGITSFEAYWRTLIFNRIPITGVAPPAKFGRAYWSWIIIFSKIYLPTPIPPDLPLYRQPRKILAFALLNGAVAFYIYRHYPRLSLVTSLNFAWRSNFMLYLAFKWIKYGRSEVKNLLDKIRFYLHGADGVRFNAALLNYCQGRKFCVTTGGAIGWVPKTAQSGDRVCFFIECALPYIIRRDGEGWKLVGDCYMHGLMGKVLTGKEGIHTETITLL